MHGTFRKRVFELLQKTSSEDSKKKEDSSAHLDLPGTGYLSGYIGPISMSRAHRAQALAESMGMEAPYEVAHPFKTNIKGALWGASMVPFSALSALSAATLSSNLTNGTGSSGINALAGVGLGVGLAGTLTGAYMALSVPVRIQRRVNELVKMAKENPPDQEIALKKLREMSENVPTGSAITGALRSLMGGGAGDLMKIRQFANIAGLRKDVRPHASTVAELLLPGGVTGGILGYTAPEEARMYLQRGAAPA